MAANADKLAAEAKAKKAAKKAADKAKEEANLAEEDEKAKKLQLAMRAKAFGLPEDEPPKLVEKVRKTDAEARKEVEEEDKAAKFIEDKKSEEAVKEAAKAETKPCLTAKEKEIEKAAKAAKEELAKIEEAK